MKPYSMVQKLEQQTDRAEYCTNQDISFFYDPATKKFRKRFEIYPQALDANVRFGNKRKQTHTELLKRIQAERQ